VIVGFVIPPRCLSSLRKLRLRRVHGSLTVTPPRLFSRPPYSLSMTSILIPAVVCRLLRFFPLTRHVQLMLDPHCLLGSPKASPFCFFACLIRCFHLITPFLYSPCRLRPKVLLDWDFPCPLDLQVPSSPPFPDSSSVPHAPCLSFPL